MFLRHEGFLGAVGAFLKVHPLSPAALQHHTSKEPRKVQNASICAGSPACRKVPADLLCDLACVQYFCIRLPTGCCLPPCRQVPADFLSDLLCTNIPASDCKQQAHLSGPARTAIQPLQISRLLGQLQG